MYAGNTCTGWVACSLCIDYYVITTYSMYFPVQGKCYTFKLKPTG